jgi:hypothetical protein
VDDLFDASDRQAILGRIDRLQPTSERQWGRMDVAQMMAHCTFPLTEATSGRMQRQRLIGKLLSPLVKKKVLGDAPFSRNGPTDPDFKVTDARDFAREKERLVTAIDAFAAAGPERLASAVHPFFGRLTGAEWGRLMGKHLDHHLRQFGV